jgi:hypothetical protein
VGAGDVTAIGTPQFAWRFQPRGLITWACLAGGFMVLGGDKEADASNSISTSSSPK